VKARYLVAHGFPSLRASSARRSAGTASSIGGLVRLLAPRRARRQGAARVPDGSPKSATRCASPISRCQSSSFWARRVRGRSARADSLGHFGLAVKITATPRPPNRRYPDLITHRLLKAALAAAGAPISWNELNGAGPSLHVARGRRQTKSRRMVRKSARGAPYRASQGRALRRHRDRRFEQRDMGTDLSSPVEGRVVPGRARARYRRSARCAARRHDVERGFIDFRARELTTSAPPGWRLDAG